MVLRRAFSLSAWLVTSAGWLAGGVVGCGGTDGVDTDVGDETQGTTESGSTTATGGDGDTGDGDGTTSGDGTTGDGDGTTGDGDGTTGDGDGVADCDNLDPSRVYLHGTFQEGASFRDALVPVGEPTSSCVGFADYANGGVIRPTDGRYIWRETFDDTALHVFASDALDWDGSQWQYPVTPYANDALIDSMGCALLLGEPVVHPDTGAVAYQCGSVWANEDGTPLDTAGASKVLALLPDGTALVIDGNAFTLAVVDAGTATPVTIPAGADAGAVVAVRHTTGGVWLAVSFPGVLERWVLTGTDATFDGTYAAMPADVISETSTIGVRIDGTGAIYQGVGLMPAPFTDGIVRRELEPAASTVVYTEADAPGGSWFDDPADPWVYIHSSRLVTGP